jgi:hypothetical protein
MLDINTGNCIKSLQSQTKIDLETIGFDLLSYFIIIMVFFSTKHYYTGVVHLLLFLARIIWRYMILFTT